MLRFTWPRQGGGDDTRRGPIPRPCDSRNPPGARLIPTQARRCDRRQRWAYAPTIPRGQLEAIAAALDCTVAAIADRAALSATTRVLYGLDPLGPARTLVAGQEYDLTDAEADRVADFIAGLITARDLH